MKKINIVIFITIMIIVGVCIDNVKISNKDFSDNLIVQKDITLKEVPNTETHIENINSGDYFPIIFNDILLGGYGESRWNTPYEMYMKLNNNELFKIYSNNKFLGECVVNRPLSSNIDQSDWINIDIDNKLNYEKNEYIGIKCPWNPIPRIPIKQDINSETYKEIVRQVLQENGISKDVPVHIKQNFKIDLEGDGTDEVIIYADNISSPLGYVEKNSYALLFVRKIMNNKVENIFIIKDIITENIDYEYSVSVNHNIKAIIDANGDNIMEVLIQSNYYEGLSYKLYKIDNNGIKLLLNNFFGE